MMFNGIEKDYITVMRGRDRPFLEVDGTREITVPIFIKHNGFSEYERLKEDVANWLEHEEPKPLEFKDDPDRLYFAKLINIKQGDSQRIGSDATIEFECHSKYSYERFIKIDDEKVKTINGHKSTPWHTRTTFTENQTSYELQFNSPGKEDLRDICKIKLNYNFIKGDVLEIDYSRRRVTLNRVDRSNILVILQSNYMELPIGSVEFSASHETELFYNERYY